MQRYYSWIIDRFHISTQVFQARAHERHYDFTWLEERLAPLGFHIVFCTRSPDTFARAREERLKVSGNPQQYDDLDAFITEQDDFRKALAKTRLPMLRLDMSDSDIPRAADAVADWLTQTGGLYAPWGRKP